MNTIFRKLINKYHSFVKEEYYALNQLDIKLKPYLNFKGGFFIEAGANNGVNQTNTLYFERSKKWRGILIEPIPDLARQCKLNRPNCIVENCALVPFDFAESYIEMRYANLMSMVVGAMKSKDQENEHIIKGCEIQQIKTYNVKVTTQTLTSILDKYLVGKIDFLSLDVEGFELGVLQGIDFDKYRPTWMLIEARYKDEINTFLKPNYEPVAELSYHDILYRSIKK